MNPEECLLSASKRPTAAPFKETADVLSDDDHDVQEQLSLPLRKTTGNQTSMATKNPRIQDDRITSLTAILRRGRDHALDHDSCQTPSEVNEDTEDDELSIDGEKYSHLLSAATGRQEFSRWQQARKDAKKARIISNNVVAGTGDEGAFRAHSGNFDTQEETLTKMIRALEGTRGDMGNLKKKLGRINSEGKQVLDTPLPAAVSSRLERAVAYEKTSEEISKWTSVVKKHRVSEHLSFPLNAPGGNMSRTSRDTAQGFNPSNRFEMEVDHLLKEAGVSTDADVLAKEEEQLQAAASVVSKNEIVARRRELARMRSVAFLNEKKLKRIKKIKSRKFRKMMKRERALAAEDAVAVDNICDDKHELALKAERERIEERMTLRHKNTSKWIRRQLQRGETNKNPSAREAVEEQLRLHEELRKRQNSSSLLNGTSMVEMDSDEESLSSSGNEENDKESLEILRNDIANSQAGPAKGLMGLKFMQDAQERKRQAAMQLLEELSHSADEEVCMDSVVSDGEDVSPKAIKAVARSKGKGNMGLKVGRRTFEGSLQNTAAEDTSHLGYLEHSSSLDGLVERAGLGSLSPDTEDNNNAENIATKEQEVMLKKKYETKDRELSQKEIFSVSSKSISNALIEADKEAGQVIYETAGHTTKLSGCIELACAEERVPKVKPLQGKTRDGGQCLASEKDDHAFRTGDQIISAKNSSLENPWLKPVHVSKKISELSETVKERRPSTEKVAHHRNKMKGDMGSTARSRKDFDTVAPHNLRESGVEDVDSKKHHEDVKLGENSDFVSCDKGKASQSQEAVKTDLDRMKTVALAFADAGGADLADFEAVKAAEVERSLPTAADVGATVLPGWGSWSGTGRKNSLARLNKPVQESPFAKAAREKLEAARRDAIKARADGKLPHVVINAKRAKKAADLTMAAVPFPFTNPEQWEREVSVPLVRERMTYASHTAVVRPKVSVPRGEAVQPLRMSIAATKELGVAGKSMAIERRSKKAKERESKRRPLLS